MSIHLSIYLCNHWVLLINLSTCFICLVNGRVMQIGQKVWFGYEIVCGLCVLFVVPCVWGFMYEFISNMTKVGWFHLWIHVRHQKSRSWGGEHIYIYIHMCIFMHIYIFTFIYTYIYIYGSLNQFCRGYQGVTSARSRGGWFQGGCTYTVRVRLLVFDTFELSSDYIPVGYTQWYCWWKKPCTSWWHHLWCISTTSPSTGFFGCLVAINSITPLKSHKPPDNWWLEDEMSTLNGPFKQTAGHKERQRCQWQGWGPRDCTWSSWSKWSGGEKWQFDDGWCILVGFIVFNWYIYMYLSYSIGIFTISSPYSNCGWYLSNICVFLAENGVNHQSLSLSSKVKL